MPRMNRREWWILRPAIYLLHWRSSRTLTAKTARALRIEWWLWRFAGTRMPWYDEETLDGCR